MSDNVTIPRARYEELLRAAGLPVVSQQEASQQISDRMVQIRALFKECEDLAVSGNVSFSFDLAYGMGGYYNPQEARWVSSSEGC